jgi:hypothetical protein
MSEYSDELERLKKLYKSPSSDFYRKKSPKSQSELIQAKPILTMRFTDYFFSSKLFNQELDLEFGNTKK